MKSVVGQVGCAPLCCFSRSSPDLSLGVAFVGAARRSLAHDSRQRAWRPTSGVDERQRTLPLLVSSEGSGPNQPAKRFDAYDYSRCRRCCENSAPSHHSIRFKPSGSPPATFFKAAFGAAASQKAEAAPGQGLGGLGGRRRLGVLLRSGSSLDARQSLGCKKPLAAFVTTTSGVRPSYAVAAVLFGLVITSWLLPPVLRFPFAWDPSLFRVSTSTKRRRQSCEPARWPLSSCAFVGRRGCGRRSPGTTGCSAD